jgi:hypothetical protein
MSRILPCAFVILVIASLLQGNFVAQRSSFIPQQERFALLYGTETLTIIPRPLI